MSGEGGATGPGEGPKGPSGASREMHPETHEPASSVKALAGKAILLACLLSAGLVALVTCTRQDPVAPDGSLITVSANPQTVVIGSASKITATLRSKNGTRLPDQEVIFSTSAGTLIPPAQTSILSNSLGQASCELATSVSATVTAFSGSIMGTTTVGVVSGALSQILISSVTPGTVMDCSSGSAQTVEVDAQDPNGDGVSGVTIIFGSEATPGLPLLPGTFSRTQATTDSSGVATSVFTPTSSTCQSNCSPSADPNAPNGGNCTLVFTAQDVTGAFKAPKSTVTVAIH
jgi:hypothetical protein